MSSEYVEIARKILREAKTASLASLDIVTSHPIVTLVNVVCDEDFTPLLLMSHLSFHTKNLENNPKCSVLLTTTGKGDALTHPRISLMGVVERQEKGAKEKIYLTKNPKAKLYYNFGDFILYSLKIENLHFNGGFGKAASLTWEEIIYSGN